MVIAMPGSSDLILGELAQAWVFVDLQAEAVAQAVEELVAVARGGERVAGERVRLLAVDAGMDARLADFERCQHGVVDRARVVARLAEADGACHVGAVAGDAGAHVDDDRLAEGEHAVGGRGVRQRAVGSAGDMWIEGHALGAALAHVAVDLAGDLALGHAGLEVAAEVGEGLVGDGDGALDGGDLVGVFHGAQWLDESARRPRARGLPPLHLALIGERGGEIVAEGDGEVRGLECPRGRRPIAQSFAARGAKSPSRRTMVAPGHSLLGLLGVAPVGDQGDRAAGDDQGAGGVRAGVVAGEAAQIAAILRVRDEQRVEASGREARR